MPVGMRRSEEPGAALVPPSGSHSTYWAASAALPPPACSTVKTPLRRTCLSFAFQMVQNFQDESCFTLSTLKGKPLPAFLIEVWSVFPVVIGWQVASAWAESLHKMLNLEQPLGTRKAQASSYLVLAMTG